MIRKFLITCLGCSALSLLQAQKGQTFMNPVIPGDVADPSVLRIGTVYYATGTSSEWAPYYPLFTSTDLVNWKQAGHLFTEQPEWTKSSFWAPELFYYKGKTYAYYTARRKSDGVSYIGVATADDPLKGFIDHGLLVEFGTEAIDAFILEDKGQLYISWKAYGLDNRPIELLASRLSSDGLRLVGEPFSLLKDDERVGMEGQHWFKQGDYYYLLYSVNSCCGPDSDYAVAVARSKTLEGPYEKYEGNPILHGGGKVKSCGHGTFTTVPDGRMFYLCHAYLNGGDFFLGRQPILQELIMGEDGWPHFTTGETASLQQPVPFPGTVQQPLQDFEDTFSSAVLRKEWSWNYVYSQADIRLKDGNLVLSGLPKENCLHGTVLCLRPIAANYVLEAEVVNSNASSKGLVFYGDDQNMIALTCRGNRLQLKMIVDGKEQLLSDVPLPASPLQLRMEITEGCNSTFYWSKDKKTWNKVIASHEADKGNEGLLRWDRAARPGLIHDGKAAEPALFSYCRMVNK